LIKKLEGNRVGKNIEIKAKISNFEKVRQQVKTISDTEEKILTQKDTFFNCNFGRLKLRDFQNGKAELIFYKRENKKDAKVSLYNIIKVSNHSKMYELLKNSNGIKGEVIKTRHLFFIGQTRIHMDKVKNLGTFLELEVVLKDNEPDTLGIDIANDIMKTLNITKNDLIEKAYIDLLLQ
jgi:predicted adenylyl cyclase CyaB